MPIYNYKAIDDQGFISEGEIEVIDKAGLELYLNARSLYLVSCSKNKKFTMSLKSKKVNINEIIIFSRQFSVMVSAGIGVDEAIRTIAAYTTNQRLSDSLQMIGDDLSSGIPMSESMAQYNKIFKYFFISMMRIGEFSGELDKVLLQTADFYEAEGKLRKRVIGALLYPIILVILIIGVVYFLMTKIIPTFEEMFKTMQVDLPLLTKALIDTSTFLKVYGIFIIIGIGFVCYGISHWYKTENGKYKIDNLIINLPVIGSVYIKTTTSRFSRSMDILLKSGVTIMQSFEIVDSLISNAVIRKRFELCKESVALGYSYSASLEKMNFFPPIMINMVAVGERTGSLSEVFDKTSSFFEDEANAAIDKAIALVEPIVLLVAGGVILAIFLAIMLPMFDLINSVQ